MAFAPAHEDDPLRQLGGGYTLRPQPRREARAREVRPRATCRVLPLKDEQGLGLALVRLLDRAIPEVHFRVGGDGPVDWVWICGFEPNRGDAHLAAVRAVRAGEPRARVLVTGRNLSPQWRHSLEAEGVDLALAWPHSLQALRERLVVPVGDAGF